jgi:hypothetical protein
MGILAGQTNRDSNTVTSIPGGWGPLAGGTDTIERGRGASMVILADNQLDEFDYIAAIFEASANSPLTPFGLGVNVINTSAAIQSGEATPTHAAVDYAHENGVVQVAANWDEYAPALGEDTVPHAWPADWDPSWIICVGASNSDKTRDIYTDYGLSLDLLAPGGDPEFGNCGLPNLNWTTRDTATGLIPHYFYGGHGGTSIAAPNVTGSAALLLSTFYRKDSVHLQHVEPEDIERILEASAWRKDADRDTLPSPNTWRTTSGYGHLDIGNAYTMMDSTSKLPSSHYSLYHYNITDTNQMSFGPWTPNVDSALLEWIFQVPTDSRANESDTLGKYRVRSYLLNYCGGRWIYNVRWRLVTATMVLPDTFEKSEATPMFAWGRGGGPTSKTGWSFDNENFQTGFTSVINGSGGSAPPGPLPGGLEEGIFHNNDTIEVQTVQYDVYGWDTSNSTYDIYLGHCPQDSSLGMNFSVFARPKIPGESVEQSPTQNGNALEILRDGNNNSAIAYYSVSSPLHNAVIQLYDDLGRLVAFLPHVNAYEGWNQTPLPVNSLASGIYLCRVSGENYSESKTFSIVR